MTHDYELIEHTADLQLRVYGTTIQELFIHAVQGMFQIIEPETKQKDCQNKEFRLYCTHLPIVREMHIRSHDQVSLLIDFLSHALYLSDIHNEAYLDATISELTETHVKAAVHGIKIERFGIEIKAVTYHDIYIEQIDGGWQADIVFDI